MSGAMPIRLARTRSVLIDRHRAELDMTVPLALGQETHPAVRTPSSLRHRPMAQLVQQHAGQKRHGVQQHGRLAVARQEERHAMHVLVNPTLKRHQRDQRGNDGQQGKPIGKARNRHACICSRPPILALIGELASVRVSVCECETNDNPGARRGNWDQTRQVNQPARVRGRTGNTMWNWLPGHVFSSQPGLSTHSLPPCAWTKPRAIASPNPGPPPLNLVLPVECNATSPVW